MTQITIPTFNLTDYHDQWGGSTATIRWYSNQDFVSSTGTIHNKQKPFGPVWYQTFSASLVGTTLTVPQMIVDSTTDSSVPLGTYTAVIFDSRGYFADYLLRKDKIPHDRDNPLTFSDILAYNADPPLPSTSASSDHAYTQAQSDARYAKLSGAAFNGGVGVPSLALTARSGDLPAAVNGQMWYDSVLGRFRGFQNGQALSLTPYGRTTFDVSSFRTSGAGTYADPYIGWQTGVQAAFQANATFYFPSGVYGWSTTFNWVNFGNMRFIGDLGTVLKYTGAGVAVSMAPTQACQIPAFNGAFGIIFENFLIDGTGTGTEGLFLGSIHHSVFRNVFIRSVTDKGLHTRFNILNTFDTIHTTTRVGNSTCTAEAAPIPIGFYFDNDGNPVNTTQACTMINLIAEFSSGIGMYLAGANQNQFLGGSSENNVGKNLVCFGHGNTFHGMDNEFSGDPEAMDFYIGGNYNKLVNCIGTGKVRIGNDVDGGAYLGNEITGGQYNIIHIDTNAQATKIDKPAFNFSSSGYFKNDSNLTTIIGAPINYLTGVPNNVSLDIPGNGVSRGDVLFVPSKGAVFVTPNGTLKRIKVADDGSLSTETATVDFGYALSDAFTGSAFGNQWLTDSFTVDPPSAAVTLAISSGAFAITLPSSTAGVLFSGKANGGHAILDAGFERIKHVSRPAAGSYQVRFSIGKSARNCLYFVLTGGTLSFNITSGGSAGGITSIAYNPVSMLYWRFLRAGVNIKAQYSPDASAWTDLGTSTGAPFLFNNFRTCLEGGTTASSTYSAPIVYDDYVLG